MSDETTIRPACPDDAPVLMELRERMLRELDQVDEARLAELSKRSLEWLAQAFPDGRAFGWIAEKDGRVVGAVSMTLTDTLPQYRSLDGRVAAVYGLFVEPEMRAAGIAGRLVQAVIAKCESLGVDVITLHAAEKARPIYERAGFAASAEMRLYLTGPASERR